MDGDTDSSYAKHLSEAMQKALRTIADIKSDDKFRNYQNYDEISAALGAEARERVRNNGQALGHNVSGDDSTFFEKPADQLIYKITSALSHLKKGDQPSERLINAVKVLTKDGLSASDAERFVREYNSHEGGDNSPRNEIEGALYRAIDKTLANAEKNAQDYSSAYQIPSNRAVVESHDKTQSGHSSPAKPPQDLGTTVRGSFTGALNGALQHIYNSFVSPQQSLPRQPKEPTKDTRHTPN